LLFEFFFADFDGLLFFLAPDDDLFEGQVFVSQEDNIDLVDSSATGGLFEDKRKWKVLLQASAHTSGSQRRN